ncbi:MAG: NADH-quinone oxidoreductase subunit C [Betaproteobacteria bacterium]|nr:NADH-quinone oxidoreductase subunit C [Betaproteobacteria bacterium]
MRHCQTTERPPEDLRRAADALLTALGDTPSAHGRMQFAYAHAGPDGSPQVNYVVSQGADNPYGLWRVAPASGKLPSLADKLPLLGWYEREMSDLYGLEFEGHPEPYPLVLHEGFRDGAPPLSARFDRHGAPRTGHALPPTEPRMIGAEIQRLPFGPVRADVVESAQFLFYYIGEGILHYHPRLFYKHRAMEARFEGASLLTGSALAERVSGVDSVAHGLAYSQAVEGALGWRAPQRAQMLRVILAELERLYNHLHYFGLLAKTTTLKVAEAEGLWLEEQIKQINARLTGNRFLRSLIAPGGLRRDLDVHGLAAAIAAVEPAIDRYLDCLESTRSYLDRLLTTGHLARQVAFDQGATGPVERASDLDRDLRRDHAYALYSQLSFEVPLEKDGDAHARARVRAREIRQTLALIRQALATLKPGPVMRNEAVEDPAPDGEGLGWVEGTRGGLLYAIHLDQTRTRFVRVKIKEPSFSNWRVFPFTVRDSNMMDYAINEASFGLSIAGADR